MSVTIKDMRATFGALEGASLAPGEGLTVITAPNERGKSTWAAFVRAMFYGIDTRERDKAGYLADKNRYLPWSGVPMCGEITLSWDGRDITLRRSGGRSGPFQQFDAVYTASGDPVPGLTGANAGQTLLGVGRDVFTRTALVGQNGCAVTPTPELESRIAALATAGQEDTSFTAAQRTLKDWRNRRRLNRSTGLIAELERELSAIDSSLAELSAARTERDEAAQHLSALRRERSELEFQRSLIERVQRRDLNRRYGETEQRAAAAREELNRLPPPPEAFMGLTARQARELTAARQAELDARQTALRARRRGLRATAAIAVPLLGAGGLAGLIAGLSAGRTALCAGGIAALLAAAAAAVVLLTAASRQSRKLAQLTEGDALPDPEAYADLLARRELLERELTHCAERLADLAAQGAQPIDTLEYLPDPTLTAEEVSQRLAGTDRALALWQSRLDRAEGALGTDPTALEARREQLEAELTRRAAEYDALTAAMEALDAANAALRERFSPALNREAAAIFSTLTGQRWSALTLSRDFSAMAGDGGAPRSALYLSAGTTDQLYLAVRLALCRLTLPGVPILLDDALCAFDDARAARALELLRDMGRERQILLFTCHSREARWARANAVPVLDL